LETIGKQFGDHRGYKNLIGGCNPLPVSGSMSDAYLFR
jgi:hypothetical protein